MMRVGDLQIHWPARPQIAQIMQRPRQFPLAARLVAALRAGLPLESPPASLDLRLGEIVGIGDPFGGIGYVFTWSKVHPALL
jgi:hypothetical protein